MFNFETIGESVKRHWIPIVIVTLLLVAVGVVPSFSKGGETVVEPAYTAEASFYISGYEKSPEVGTYNYQLGGAEDMLITDARRVIVSNEVAGEVRRQFGEDVTVSSPFWVNEKTNGNFYTRFIFVDASAPTPEIALQATDFAAEKASQIIRETLPVTEVTIVSPAALSSVQGKAADFGVDKPVSKENPLVAVASSVNIKNVIIYGFVGLVGSLVVFVAYDVLSRRVRSVRDIERLLAVPSLASVRTEDDYAFLAEDVKVLLERNDIASLVVAGCVKADGAVQVAHALEQRGLTVTGSASAAVEPDAVQVLSQAEGVLIALGCATAKSRDLDRLSEALRIAGTPVVGAVFVPRKR
ncbi:MAG: hypothetical protein RR842_13415 [Gordonibacter sp.]|uniref:YveK family protein n=1 Tax=Gordonibacter sp. TaxID=1968902 RepID=UPI002FC79D37